MCSQAERQSVAILATISGSIKVLLSEKRFSQLNVRNDLSDLEALVDGAIEKWAKMSEKDVFTVHTQQAEWAQELDAMGIPDDLKTVMLVKISLLAATDLFQKVKQPGKIVAMASIVDRLEIVDKFVDADGTAFSSLELTDKILQSLYNKIGFVR